MSDDIDIEDEFDIDEGPDTNPDYKQESSSAYLQAFQRYKGRTFSKVTPDAWNKLTSNTDSVDCVILSAFYGIVRFNEPIRNYTIRQDTKMNSGQQISKFWRDQGAHNWLYEYIENNKFDDVKFVLSTEYSGIVGKEELMMKLKDNLGIDSEDKQFKEGGGLKSMALRGQYINNFLLSEIK